MMKFDRQNDEKANQNQSGWPINFSVLRNPPNWFANFVTVLLFVIAIVLILLSLVAIVQLSFDLFSSDRRHVADAVKAILPMTAAAVGFPLIIWRLHILNVQTKISELKTQIDRETHYTSIFSRSIDQLGQTREQKTTNERDGVIETMTRTVPNIEVRLGGIHSLVRLAEESIRDREKIINTLLSYVRENSWSDRDGVRQKERRLNQPWSASPFWDFCSKFTSENSKNLLKKWMSENNKAADERTKWAQALMETRVDVNEAIDAIKLLAPISNLKLNQFIECLFVGRFFVAGLLKNRAFHRCTFIRCRFSSSDITNITFWQCNFNNCFIDDIANSNLRFFSCELTNTSIRTTINSELNFEHCNIYSSYLSGSTEAKLMFKYCTVHNGSLSFEKRILMIAYYSHFPQFSFMRVEFNNESSFDGCSFTGTNFKSANLALVKEISGYALAHAEANPRTRIPEGTARPASWPVFDPEYDDDLNDEVPF